MKSGLKNFLLCLDESAKRGPLKWEQDSNSWGPILKLLAITAFALIVPISVHYFMPGAIF